MHVHHHTYIHLFMMIVSTLHVSLMLFSYGFCCISCLEEAAPEFIATKTPYETARKYFDTYLKSTHGGENTIVESSLLYGDGFDGDQHITTHPSSCKAIQYSLLLRHGTRFPSKGDIKRVANLLEKWHKLDINEEYAATKYWVNDFTKANEKILSDSGKRENFDIASRVSSGALRSLFEQAFTATESDDSFELAASDTQRTNASAEGFIDGLAASLDLDASKVMSQLKMRNDLIRFFDRCHNYKYKVEEDDESLVEFTKFSHGPEAKKAAERLSMRVTASNDPTILNTDDLRTVVVMCGFENALRGSGSPWCDMLTEAETEVLEYAWDLKLFWRKSYGFAINYEQSCPLLSDMMMNLHHAANTKSAPKVSLYFGHAETVLPLQALLGLFHDQQELRADNFEQMKNRKFRGSFIASFATNLGLTLFECDQGEQTTHEHWPSSLSNRMIQLTVNEHVVPFPFTHKLAVSFEDFEDWYYQWVHHCDFDTLCQNVAKDEL